MNTLSDKAMLVRLGISQWTGRKYDKAVSERVAQDYQTSADSGRYNKMLIAEYALKRIGKAANEGRTFHYENTLPWNDNGYRVLPSANYLPYTQKMQSFRVAFEQAVCEFIVNYPDLVEDAKTRLNGMFKQEDYPDPREIAAKYSFDIAVMPLPDAADFRVSLQLSEVESIRADIETRTQAAAAAGLRDLWDRLHSAVARIASTLGDPDAIFRDSLTKNLVDLCELLPRLNVFDDPDLETMRQDIESQLCGVKSQTLRDDLSMRKSTAKSAAAILETMAGYTG